MAVPKSTEKIVCKFLLLSHKEVLTEVPVGRPQLRDSDREASNRGAWTKETSVHKSLAGPDEA